MRMNKTVKIPILIQQLKNAEDETEHFVNGFESSETNSGARYLYQSVLLPLLNDQPVETGNLDMDSFDREDIGTLSEFYNNNFTCYSKEMSKLRRIYEICSGAPARPVSVCFL